MGPNSWFSTWSVVDRLDQVRVPSLVINGAKDISQDFVVEPFVQKIPNAKWVKFENSSHMPFWEERAHYMTVVSDYVKA